MEKQNKNEKIIWVQGNRQSVIIPMEREVIPEEGEPYTEDFYPAEGDVVKVALTGSYKPYIYTPEIDGNLLIVTDNGTLPKGLYGVQITVTGSNGETRLRSFWDQQIVVTERNNSVLKEWNEFKQQDVKARAAVFFFAKGDPFTYEDFTPEQIENIKRPATEAAELAETAAGHAEQAADSANGAAAAANEKAGYAQQQGDYAKQKADEIEDAKGQFPNLNARLDNMQSDIDNRLDRITNEEFNTIFD
jgi:hypothetical protein